MKAQLRPYQQQQLQFLQKRSKSPLSVAVESPTGSGKSVTILAFVEWWKEKHPGAKVVISTGFNNLVHQFKEDADAFGVPAMVLIGKGNANCARKAAADGITGTSGIPVFERSPRWKCVPSACSACTNPECLFKEASQKAASGSVPIITNHSSLLFYQHIFGDADLLIVDEAHTFGGFYEGWLNLEISPVEIAQIQRTVDELSAGRNPAVRIFQKGLSAGSVSPRVLSTMLQMLGGSEHLEHPLHPVLIRKMEQFAKVEPAVDKWIHTGEDGISVRSFYSAYRFRRKPDAHTVLFSATIDEFTVKMFGVHDTRIYRERTYRSIDYTRSKFIISPWTPEKTAAHLVAECEAAGGSSGLILSTTTELVRSFAAAGDVGGWKVHTSIGSFEEARAAGEKAILAGSRALFQGVDMHDLDFVLLNSIPFPRYDDCFKQQSQYIQQVTKLDPWRYFTIPKVANDMIQSTGRLWRRPGDEGIIAVSDPRLHAGSGGRFAWMQRMIVEARPGIVIEELPVSEEETGSEDGGDC